MTRCPFLPFLEYEYVTDEEVNCFTIEVVTFTQDFGPYKKGDKVDSLSFDFISGTCIEYVLTRSDIYEEKRRFNVVCSWHVPRNQYFYHDEDLKHGEMPG